MKLLFNASKLMGLLISAALLQSCMTTVVTSGAQAAYEHRSWQNSLHDQYLAVQIDRAIHWRTDDYKTSRIAVSVFNTVVILTGQTPSSTLQHRLISISKSVPGIDKVYNLTTVNSPTSPLVEASDTWITAKIKTRIIATNEIDPNQIKVITENGIVILIGTVFPDQASIATTIARETTGVQRVIRVFSYLHVSKNPLPTLQDAG